MYSEAEFLSTHLGKKPLYSALVLVEQFQFESDIVV